MSLRSIHHLLSLSLLLAGAHTGAGVDLLAHPDVDALNVRVGTQTFGVKYQFTTNTALVETALAIREMGSDILKFDLGRGVSRQYNIPLPPTITNLTSLARDEPSCRRVLDMPFRHILTWVSVFASSGAWWKDGFSPSEKQREYEEVYDLTRYFLTNYNGSGKSFYFGHWEGDWYLLPNYNTTVNPAAVTIQGMIDWLNTRQAAVDAAVRDVPHGNVAVYHYTEVNRVRDAMNNPATNNQRLVNMVLPQVTNIDFVSWSSYDGMDLDRRELEDTLDFIEKCMPTNKAGAIRGKRVFVGEYGWGGSRSGEEQEPLTRAYIQKVLAWGARFVLFWEMYNNEPGRQYWLIDTNNVKMPAWHLHTRFANLSRLQAARFLESHGRLPNLSELNTLTLPPLNHPLPSPVPITVTNISMTVQEPVSVTLEGQVIPGVYGQDAPRVFLAHGRRDGGTALTGWDTHVPAGSVTNFNPVILRVALTNLSPGIQYHFRFYATNSSGQFWSQSSFQTNGPKAARTRIRETP